MHAVFERAELFGADRTARVHASGRDTDLAAETEFAAVRELGRRIVQDDRRIDLREEPGRRTLVVRDDAVGVVRSVAPDVVDRGVETVDGPDGDDSILELPAPVVVLCRDHARDGFECGGLERRAVAPDLASRRAESIDQRNQMRFGDGAVDQKGLRRAADAGSPQLGIEHDLPGHAEVGCRVDIDVHDAFEMREHRDARLRLHPLHERPAAARDDHVDGPVEPREHHPDRGAVLRRNQLDRVLGQAGSGEPLDEAAMDRRGRAPAVRAAAQNGGVSGPQRQRAGVRGDVRAAFEHDADHPERRAHAFDPEPVRPCPRLGDGADGIGQGGDGFDARRDAVDPRRIEPKPV